MNRSSMTRRDWLARSAALGAVPTLATGMAGALAGGFAGGMISPEGAGVASCLASETVAGTRAGDTAEPIEIGSRRELFLDRQLVESSRDIQWQLGTPQPQEVAIECDEPWEGSACGYFRVLRDGGKYRMWYMTYHWPFTPEEKANEKKPKHPFYVAYAESDDGVAWRKPQLGLYEFAGSKANNICCIDVIDNFTPFIDTKPGCPPDARYKAVGIGKGGLLAFVSPDGIHWQRMQEAPVITKGAFDTQNIAFWDAAIGKYRVYIRDFHDGIRDIRTCTSDDFKTWTAPESLRFQAGLPDEQLYTNGVEPYYRAPHIYVGFPTRYVERPWSISMRALPDLEHREWRSKAEQRIGTAITDGLLMSSRDGVHFERWGEAFIRNGIERPGTWVYGDCYQAYGLVETAGKFPGASNELSLYLPENYWHKAAKMRRYSLRVDGFVSARAGFMGGELTTRLIRFAGKSLSINFSTSAAGNVRVELVDAEGKPYPGYAFDDCDELFGDTLDRTVTWREKPDLNSLAGKAVKVRFRLRDADLFSYRFSE